MSLRSSPPQAESGPSTTESLFSSSGDRVLVVATRKSTGPQCAFRETIPFPAGERQTQCLSVIQRDDKHCSYTGLRLHHLLCKENDLNSTTRDHTVCQIVYYINYIHLSYFCCLTSHTLDCSLFCGYAVLNKLSSNIYIYMICVFPSCYICADFRSKKNVECDLNNRQCRVIFQHQKKPRRFSFDLSRGCSITVSRLPLIHTCYFGDALQFGDWKSDN